MVWRQILEILSQFILAGSSVYNVRRLVIAGYLKFLKFSESVFDILTL
jgi:hypothetical protein